MSIYFLLMSIGLIVTAILQFNETQLFFTCIVGAIMCTGFSRVLSELRKAAK